MKSKQSEMTEARYEMLHPRSKFREWMRNILGLFFTALLIFVLFKVIMLSRDVEESRRMLKELSSRLAKAKRENDDLRKELWFTKAKVDNIKRKFSNAQKVIMIWICANFCSKSYCRPIQLHTILSQTLKINILNRSFSGHIDVY